MLAANLRRSAVVSISESAFYDAVAKEIGLKSLDERQATTAYNVRLNAIFNFELSGKTPSPEPSSKLIDAAWHIAQETISEPLHIISNPAH